jgi:hypothetical protein
MNATQEYRAGSKLATIDAAPEGYLAACFVTGPSDYQTEDRQLVRCRTFKTLGGAVRFARGWVPSISVDTNTNKGA